MPVPRERLPKICRSVVADFLEVNHMTVFLCAVPNDAGIVSILSFEINAEKEAAIYSKVAVRDGLL